jgi:hypothetical protein
MSPSLPNAQNGTMAVWPQRQFGSSMILHSSLLDMTWQ